MWIWITVFKQMYIMYKFCLLLANLNDFVYLTYWKDINQSILSLSPPISYEQLKIRQTLQLLWWYQQEIALIDIIKYFIGENGWYTLRLNCIYTNKYLICLIISFTMFFS